MRTHLLFVGLAVISVAADSPEDAIKQDFAKMTGDWSIVSYTVDGKPAPEAELKTIKLEMKGAQSTFWKNGIKSTGSYKLNASVQPKTLDIEIATGPLSGKSYLSIYEFKGEELRICHAPPGKARPASFESKAGTGNVLEVWKRAK
jgi:uncharacterized protein (TIGR03067 family)